MSRKNKLLIVVFIVASFLTFRTIITTSKQFTWKMFVAEITAANHIWLVLGFLCSISFIIFEGLALDSIINGLTGKLSKAGVCYSAADIFFSAITPSSTGGQPASALLMMKDGISGATTAMALMINLIIYNLSYFVFGIVAVSIGWSAVSQMSILSQIIIVLGCTAILGLAIIMLVALVRDSILFSLGVKIIDFAHRLKLLKDKNHWHYKLVDTIRKFRKCLIVLKGNKRLVISAVFFNLLQRFANSMVAVCCYLGVGGLATAVGKVWAIQMISTIGANGIPMPGGIGVADYLMIDGFDVVEDIDNVANFEILTRGISFYSCIFISGVIVVFAYMRRKEEKKNARCL